MYSNVTYRKIIPYKASTNALRRASNRCVAPAKQSRIEVATYVVICMQSLYSAYVRGIFVGLTPKLCMYCIAFYTYIASVIFTKRDKQ